jgi:hypothetical protein
MQEAIDELDISFLLGGGRYAKSSKAKDAGNTHVQQASYNG